MTDKNFDEVPENEGSDAAASGPAPDSGIPENADAAEAAAAEGSDDDLTVDDILNAMQTDEATLHDADGAGIADAEHALLNDLKRLQAEYANYRRRTEEQRHIEIARAKGEAAKGLLPVLDDLDRAQQHGDLAEGTAFAVIAEKVRTVVERLGVVAYGAAGEEFDPQHHEAIFQQPTPGATTSTILEVAELGYRLGDVELRPAKVVVAVPAE
ncbi:nucleotide exchange factor GrpE [Microbacterium esteraromaticum]|uniref:Protein GrpE n=1 Tax=Microbacterium esteraromaticum TaxID=57043 RepID=A0A939DTB8_9MICO|nr:nucleotide exchange factor GrpE [Microbacterium esteraromaticum]MBN7794155.1 nucleotide exchange factor GrpE [Microbacterium esteraromaticum]MBN8204556.1 nucleotide exchange factor GrpE [Microbacterium esteraromaticum]MBN8414710.1 nucleotide exchange factor GrpE [Microbacterium esteraromaticum]MBN8425027.1 nucleotide exchange factor GrpE [Microbacterium esteraromaticum]